ncbi:hypothetical protein [Haladaptatus sp. NG-WS-4]
MTVSTEDTTWTVHQSNTTDSLPQGTRTEHVGVEGTGTVTVHVEWPTGTEVPFENLRTNRRSKRPRVR